MRGAPQDPSRVRDFVMIAALATLVLCLLFVASCTSPVKTGAQGRLKATLPVAAELIFE